MNIDQIRREAVHVLKTWVCLPNSPIAIRYFNVRN